MPRIPEAELDRIKQSIDLAALVRSRGVELKKHGAKDLIGRCPFHDEASASFVVTPHKRIFHCLGCGAAGNVIQFVERFDGVSFRHAFELLAAGSGFAAPAERRNVSTVPRLEPPLDFAADDSALMRQVIDYYHERLMSAATGAPARAYLKQRGLDDEGLLKRFKIGFADRSLGLRLPLKNRKDGAEIRTRLTKLGLYRETGHEHFNGCLIVPIFKSEPDGRMGDVTEVYGRRLDDGGKSGIKHLYLPGPHVGLFNAEALNEPEVILCEAIFDALTFLAAGFANVSTIYGTEGFTDELFEALKRRKVQRVKLAYDADDAGERAATRDAARLRAVGIEVYRVRFPWGMDANEYARKVTPAAQSLKLLVNAAAWLGNGAALVAAAPASPVAAALPLPSAPASKNGAASHVAPAPSSLAASLAAEGGTGVPPVASAAGVPPAVSNNEAAKKESVDRDAATVGEAKHIPAAPGAPRLIEAGEFHTFSMDGREYRLAGLAKNNGVETLRLTLRVRCGELMHSDQIDLCRDNDRRRYTERAAEECAITPEAVKRDLSRLLLACEQWQEARATAINAESKDDAPAMTAQEEAEALAWLREPKLIERIEEAFTRSGVVGEATPLLTAYFVGTSRLLERPLGVIIQSSSAAGKSTLMDAALAFFPECERTKYSAMTGQSLYYLGETNIKHKILAIVEEAGAEKASYALKLLLSEGELTIASTGKDPHNGRMETQLYRVEGPCALLLTTTSIEIDEELQNRCLVLTVDESPEQTARIHAAQRRARTMDGLLEKEERADTLRVLRNAQRLLKSVRIFNPYAEALTFPHERTRTRRDHEKYLALIEAVALLHQHQRPLEKISNGRREIEVLRVLPADIALANRLAGEVLARSLDELPPQTRKLWNHVRELVKARRDDNAKAASIFSRRELRQRCGWSETQVRVHLQRLEELEYLTRKLGRQGVGFVYETLAPLDDESGRWHVRLIDADKLQLRPDFAGESEHFADTSRAEAREAAKPETPKKKAS